MSTNLFLKDFALKAVMPVFAAIGFFLTIYLPVSFALSNPEPSQPECRITARAGNQFDIRCTLPTEESQPPKIPTSLRRA